MSTSPRAEAIRSKLQETIVLLHRHGGGRKDLTPALHARITELLDELPRHAQLSDEQLLRSTAVRDIDEADIYLSTIRQVEAIEAEESELSRKSRRDAIEKLDREMKISKPVAIAGLIALIFVLVVMAFGLHRAA